MKNIKNNNYYLTTKVETVYLKENMIVLANFIIIKVLVL